MKNEKGQTLWFELRRGGQTITSFIPTNETQIKDLMQVEKILGKVSGDNDWDLVAVWQRKDGLFKATWDDREGFVMHAYGETRAAAKERMIELFVPQCESPELAREMVEKDVDEMYSVKQVAERDDAEG